MGVRANASVDFMSDWDHTKNEHAQRTEPDMTAELGSMVSFPCHASRLVSVELVKCMKPKKKKKPGRRLKRGRGVALDVLSPWTYPPVLRSYFLPKAYMHGRDGTYCWRVSWLRDSTDNVIRHCGIIGLVAYGTVRRPVERCSLRQSSGASSPVGNRHRCTSWISPALKSRNLLH